MCGIAAILRPAGGAREPALCLQQALRHRGPDGQGLWVHESKEVAIVHTRLAVISPEDGKQPFVSDDGMTVCAVNGEIYGHQALRQRLQRRGAIFKTGSDCEVVLQAYLLDGTRAFSSLNGEWCAVIWDARLRTLIIARDRFGAKTCVWRRHSQGIDVASEAKALFTLSGPPRWDSRAWQSVLAMQYLPDDCTLFEGIHMVPPAGLVVVQGGAVSVGTWAQGGLQLGGASFGASGQLEAPDDAPMVFRSAFTEAVQTRLVSDAQYCFHLSGGIDSAAVLGTATQLSGQRQDAFTVSFAGSSLDELSLAQQTARFNEARLHVVEIRPEQIIDELLDAARSGEGLAVNGHLSAHFAMDRLISAQGFKSVLSGEGADELLAGYPHLRQDWARHEGVTFDATGQDDLRGMLFDDTAPTQAALGGLDFMPAFLEAKAGIGDKLRSWLRPQAKLEPLKPELPSTWKGWAGRHPVDISSALWTRWALGGYILPTLSDRLLGAHGLEGRLPFLDPRLFDLVHRWPMDLRIRDGVEKWVLREAMRGVVPEPVRIRRKHPFMAPCPIFCNDPKVMARVDDILGAECSGAWALFDPAQIRADVARLRQAPVQAQRRWSPALMLALTAYALGEAYGIES